MPTNTGTLTLKDLLSERHQSVAQFDANEVIETIRRDQAAFNRQLDDMFGLLAVQTSDRQRISGASGAGRMTKVDEVGTAPTQKVGAGGTVGFPFEAWQYNLGWTRRWMDQHSPAEMAEQTIGAQNAHMTDLFAGVKRAIYTSTNTTFRDRLQTPQLDLAVKAFANADSFPMPNGPNGEIFTASTHQHYTAAATLVAADIIALVNNVVEHGFGGRLMLVINTADATAFAALTGFIAMQPVTIIPASTTAVARGALATDRLNDRQIGVFNGVAEVWVKPWAIANYAFAFDSADSRKPLVLRTRNGAAPTLDVVSTFELYPLQAEYMETEYGFGVWNRTNGSVHQFSNGTYVIPTIT